MSHFAQKHVAPKEAVSRSDSKSWIVRIIGFAAVGAIGYAIVKVVLLLTGLTRGEVGEVGMGLFATFLRVNLTLLLGAAWTVPVGVWIGFNPKLARIAQPLAQIAASIPATAYFPVILLLLIKIGSGIGIGAMIFLLLGTQWYILFNVIAGAMAIPTDLKEACAIARITGWQRWRKLILPGIFPYLLTGLVTASGGAWNASIVAEYTHLKGDTFSTVGLGSLISQASDAGNFVLLIASTLVMATAVVITNRLVWRRMYRLAETRFRLES
jgi:NitT/TauT family transport system permease protein